MHMRISTDGVNAMDAQNIGSSLAGPGAWFTFVLRMSPTNSAEIWYGAMPVQWKT